MAKYFKKSEDWFYDGLSCMNAQGKCICADCFYYGEESVNCAYAGDFSGKPFKWNGTSFEPVEA